MQDHPEGHRIRRSTVGRTGAAEHRSRREYIPALRWDVRDHSRSGVKMGVNMGFPKMFTKRWHLTRKA